MKEFPARKPVFVDSSGQRHRTVRKLGAVLAVPAAAYVVLLVSSVLGGPRLDTPLVPLPEAAKHQPVPRVTPAPERAAESPKPGEAGRTPETSVRPVAEEESTPTNQERPNTPTPVPSTPVASTPTVVPTPSSTPTVTPGPPSKTPGQGKPTAPPGRTKSPDKP